MKCFACGGPFHPATGHYHREDVAICGPCTRHMIKWVKGMMGRKFRGHDFYEHAATSIRAGRSGIADGQQVAFEATP